MIIELLKGKEYYCPREWLGKHNGHKIVFIEYAEGNYDFVIYDASLNLVYDSIWKSRRYTLEEAINLALSIIPAEV